MSSLSSRSFTIGFYAPELPDSGVANGIVTYTRIMRDALRALGHSVLIVTSDHLEHPDGTVSALPAMRGISGRMRQLLESVRSNQGCDPWSTLRVFDAFRAVRGAGADIFEIEESFGWAGRVAGQGLPIVERLHGPHVFVRDRIETRSTKKKGDYRQAAELASFKRVDAITSPTQRLLDELAKLYGPLAPVTRAIPNPMAVAHPSATWSLERADADQLLFVGRFDECKGPESLIQAFAAALRERPSLSLTMVGPDRGLPRPNGTVVSFDQFVAEEVAPEVRERIRFLGAQSPAAIAELRVQSGVAVVTSRFETFSYAIAEAMSVGMPIITTETFGGAEMIRDGVEGRVVPVDDVAALSSAIIETTKNPEIMAERGRAAYKRASEWLSPERIARATVDLYREVLARP